MGAADTKTIFKNLRAIAFLDASTTSAGAGHESVTLVVRARGVGVIRGLRSPFK